MREINPFRLTMCVLNDHIKSPKRNNERLAVSSEQQMFASLQAYNPTSMSASEEPLSEGPPWEKLVPWEPLLL